ncbi:hypothetical protein [Neisseria musculi]|nr:hypothetical protein [Neisseria musculi]
MQADTAQTDAALPRRTAMPSIARRAAWVRHTVPAVSDGRSSFLD